MSISKKGKPSPFKGKKRPELIGNINGFKENHVPWNKGRPWDEETKRKVSETKKKNPTRYWLGKKRDPELIKKMNKIRLQNPVWNKGKECPQFAGVNHWNWQGGNRDVHSFNFKSRISPKLRSEHDCRMCSTDKDLIVHHIDHNKKNDSLDNLDVLCRGCHQRLHTAEKRLEILYNDEVFHADL